MAEDAPSVIPNAQDESRSSSASSIDPHPILHRSRDDVKAIKELLEIPKSHRRGERRSIVRLSIELHVCLRLTWIQLHIVRGRPERTRTLLHQAIDTAHVLRDQLLQGRCSFWQGVVLTRLGQPSDAVDAFLRAYSDLVEDCLERQLLPNYLRAYYNEVRKRVTELWEDSKQGEVLAGIDETIRGTVGSATTFQPRSPADSEPLSGSSRRPSSIYSTLLEETKTMINAPSSLDRTTPRTGSESSSQPSPVDQTGFVGIDKMLRGLNRSAQQLVGSRRRSTSNMNITGNEATESLHDTEMADLVDKENVRQMPRNPSRAGYQDQERDPQSERAGIRMASDIYADTRDIRTTHHGQIRDDNPGWNHFWNMSQSVESPPSSSDRGTKRSSSSDDVLPLARLSDTLALSKLNARSKSLSDRSGSSGSGRSATLSIQIGPGSGSSNSDGHSIRQSRRESTEPVMPSPLRGTFLPENASDLDV